MSKLPKIVLIGSGNLATNLGLALKKSNFEIAQVYSRSVYKARKLAKRVEAKATNKFKSINPNADLYLVLVPDQHVLEITKQICEQIISKNTIITHSSGATALIEPKDLKSKSLIKKIKDHQISFGVFYPLQSFKKELITDFKAVPFLLESQTPSALKRLKTIAKKLSKKVLNTDSNTRLKYHLSAVLVNNFVTHIFCKNMNFIKSNKLDPSVLDPIIKLTFEQLLTQDPCGLQTGPAKRDDKTTIQKHLQLIKKDKELLELYIEISQSITKTYLGK